MIKQQIVDELHRSARRNYPRRSVVLKGIDDLWQADLIDFKNLKSYNTQSSFILVVIDCFSKFVWVYPLKTKNKTEVTDAFKQIIRASKRSPKHLQTDLGTEFYSSYHSFDNRSLFH